MSKGMGTPDWSLKFRDIIETLVEGVINKLRPKPFNAEIVTVDIVKMTAMVRTSGNTDPAFDIQVNIMQTLVPAQEKTDTTPGNQVEVSGEPGAYWITKIYSGEWVFLNNLL
jgi:hypothetical protein